jgi:hypothetical protein
MWGSEGNICHWYGSANWICIKVDFDCLFVDFEDLEFWVFNCFLNNFGLMYIFFCQVAYQLSWGHRTNFMYIDVSRVWWYDIFRETN